MTIQQQKVFEADILYRESVIEWNEKEVVLRTDFDFTDAQNSWDAITETEAAAFMIPPNLCHALTCAHERYMAFAGISINDFWDVQEEERARFPDLFSGEAVYSHDLAPSFMSEVCGLPLAACISWVCRYQIQLLRSGLLYGVNGEDIYELKADQKWQQATIEDY